VISAVFGAETESVFVDFLADGGKMSERNTDDDITFDVSSLDSCVYFFGKFDTLLKSSVHFPVACDNVFSHYYCCLNWFV